MDIQNQTNTTAEMSADQIMVTGSRASVRLHLGCGTTYKRGYLNVDIVPGLGDMVIDLNQTSYPFEDNSVDEVLMEHVLEHLNDIAGVMNELHRILKPDGKAIIVVPHFSSYGALTSYEHKHYFHFNTLAFLDVDNPTPDTLYPVKPWRILERELIFQSPFRLMDRLCSYFFNRYKYLYTVTGFAYLFPAYTIRFVLCKPLPEEEQRWFDQIRSKAGRKYQVRKASIGSYRGEGYPGP